MGSSFAKPSVYVLLTLFCLPAFSQSVVVRRSSIAGHLPPRARPENDIGRLDPSTPLQHLSILLKPSPAQQADLDTLLADQQDPASPSYHQWLTPEAFAQRFGASSGDIATVTAWLRSQNLSVDGVSRGHNSISFSGLASSVEQAFGTELHRYRADGTAHFANAALPSVPATIAGKVAAIRGLHNFRLNPPKQALAARPKPRYTNSTGQFHYLAPDDVATLYDIQPLYAAGIDGSGQKIAVVGQTQLPLDDIRQFRTYFNLPPSDPTLTLVPNTQDPGIYPDDLVETDLDVEWAGAIARNAAISYVYSYDVVDALYYVIDQNLAPVVSMSYGLCEAQTAQSDLTAFRSYAQQANAQGITWIAASGDSGGNDCYGLSSRGNGILGVDAPASVPEVTGVGGTTLNEGSGNYWAANTGNHASILSWIPEKVWNDSGTSGIPSASGGGSSTVYFKPSWQTGPGVPADNARMVPDISFSASADHDAYLFYNDGSLGLVGGTSAGAPSFAGVVALLNQYLVSNGLQASPGMGNVNPRLYTLAQTVPGAFHDVVDGDNIVTSCSSRSRSCTTGPIGYAAGPGYDRATGLGSLDVFNLVSNWRTSSSNSVRPTAALSVRLTSPQPDTAAIVSTVGGANGITPTGSISFSANGADLGSAPLSGSAGIATASFSLNTSGLTSVLVRYSGDANYVASTITLGLMSLDGVVDAASYKRAFASGMIVAVFGGQLASQTQTTPGLPLPQSLGGTVATVNGVPASLYFVSPGQINMQIPPGLTTGSTAILKITNSLGQSVTGQMPIDAAAPGIFTDTNNALPGYPSAARGQQIALYITGDGGNGNPIVNVGGVRASVVYSGVPSWSVGVTQINFTVPPSVSTGAQPVTVTVANVTSAAATLAVR